jgi:hypothetical protein
VFRGVQQRQAARAEEEARREAADEHFARWAALKQEEDRVLRFLDDRRQALAQQTRCGHDKLTRALFLFLALGIRKFFLLSVVMVVRVCGGDGSKEQHATAFRKQPLVCAYSTRRKAKTPA